jgi:hypothetical protein
VAPLLIPNFKFATVRADHKIENKMQQKLMADE